MFPPETTATTGPSPQIGDARPRAGRRRRPPRPARRRASRARRGSAAPSRISSSLRCTTSSTSSSQTRRLSSPIIGAVSASAIVADGGPISRALRTPCARPRASRVAAGCTAMTRADGASALTATATPDTRPPPLVGTSTAPGCGTLRAQLEPDGGGAGDHAARRRTGAARCARLRCANSCIRANASRAVGGLEVDGGSVAAGRRDLRLARGARHEDDDVDPGLDARQRRRLGVVAGRHGDDARRRAPRAPIAATRLVAPRSLNEPVRWKSSAISVRGPADPLGQAARGEDRRAVDPALERPRGGVGVVDRRERPHRGQTVLPPQCGAVPTYEHFARHYDAVTGRRSARQRGARARLPAPPRARRRLAARARLRHRSDPGGARRTCRRSPASTARRRCSRGRARACRGRG